MLTKEFNYVRAQKGSIFTFCYFFWVQRCKRCHSKIGNVRLVFRRGNTSCKTFKYTKWFITSNFPQRDRKMGPKKGNELPLAMDCYRRWQRCLFRDQERSDRQGSDLKAKRCKKYRCWVYANQFILSP